MSTWLHAAAAGAGGAVGAALRFGINELLIRKGWLGLPLATLVANVVGCFLAGLILTWLDTRGAWAPLLRNLLVVGVIGGLTTFSALGVELWQFLRANRVDLAVLVAATHLLLGIGAVAAGYALGRQVWAATG